MFTRLTALDSDIASKHLSLYYAVEYFINRIKRVGLLAVCCY